MKHLPSDTIKTCDSCRIKKKSWTGKEILSKDKLTYKWICKECLEKKYS